MPIADYKCDKCNTIIELDINDNHEHCQVVVDEETSLVCLGNYNRVWSPISTGKVNGAGGSPARYSKGK